MEAQLCRGAPGDNIEYIKGILMGGGNEEVGVLFTNSDYPTEFRAVPGGLKFLKFPVCSQHKPSMFSGHKIKIQTNNQTSKQRAVDVLCKWPSVYRSECQENMDKKPLTSAIECNVI